MPNWNKYKLKEITAKIGSGATPRGGGNSYKTEGISLIRSQNVLDFKISLNGLAFIDELQAARLNNVTVEKNDVLLNITGDSVARVCQVTKSLLPARVNQHVAIIRPERSQLDASFLKYYLLTPGYKNHLLMLASSGGTRKALTKEMIENLEITLPPLPTQNRIAEILGTLDDKIELNLQMNKTLEEMAMALYKHWFVDFGPFKEGEFVDSELGRIPKGWEVIRLGELLNIKHGFAFKSKFFTTSPNKNLLLTPGNFEPNGGIKFNWAKQKFYNGEFPEEYILNRGDLVLTLTDLTQDCRILGSPALIPDNDYNYLHNQRLGLVSLKSQELNKSIFYRFFNTTLFRNHIIGSKTGSTVSHTAPVRIYNIPFLISRSINYQKLGSQLNQFDEMIFNNLSETKELVKTRDYFLPKLISGEVEVNATEKEIEEIVK